MMIEVAQQAIQNLREFGVELAKKLESEWLMDPKTDTDWTPEYIAAYNDGVRGAANAILSMVETEL